MPKMNSPSASPGYGLTESSGTTHYTRPDDITLGSVGPVVPNVQYKVC